MPRGGLLPARSFGFGCLLINPHELASNGADLVKVYENLSREAYFAIIDEARRRAIPVDGHVPFRIRPEEAAAAGEHESNGLPDQIEREYDRVRPALVSAREP